MPDLTGTTIGQYRLISTMGQGGMATVYRGYQAGMERYVAVKVINPEHGVDPNFVQRFRQEARVIAALEHPNILPVYDYGEAQGITYLVMRLVGSGTLADQMTGQPVPLDQVRRLLAEVGDALDYAHSRGVIHRDIKPSNILLDERGHTLLSDFGIAKLAQNLTGLTMTGSFVGTPYYASPEQALGQELDGRSDLYSLGVILYEMATGRQPYVADTPMAVLFKHIQEPLPAPRSLNPNLPPAVEQVIVKALSKNRTERFPTGAALSAALNAALVPGATAAGGRTVMEPAPDPNAAARTLLDRGMTPPGGQPIAPAYTAAPGAYPTAYPSQMPAAAPPLGPGVAGGRLLHFRHAVGAGSGGGATGPDPAALGRDTAGRRGGHPNRTGAGRHADEHGPSARHRHQRAGDGDGLRPEQHTHPVNWLGPHLRRIYPGRLGQHVGADGRHQPLGDRPARAGPAGRRPAAGRTRRAAGVRPPRAGRTGGRELRRHSTAGAAGAAQLQGHRGRAARVAGARQDAHV